MYTTEWNISQNKVTDSFINFIKNLEETLHDSDGQITVKTEQGNTAAEVELYNIDDPQELFKIIEKEAINTLGTENYTAWTSGQTMTVSE